MGCNFTWVKFILENKIVNFYYLAAAALAILLVSYYYNTQEVKSSVGLVDHTQEVLRISNHILINTVNIESDMRWFILTKNTFFLEHFNNAATAINGDLHRLEVLSKNNPNQKTQIDSLKKKVEERMVLTRNIIESFRQVKFNETEKKVIIAKGEILSDKIKKIIADISAEEFNLIKQRKTENEKTIKNSDQKFFLILFLILVIYTLVIIIIKNQNLKNKYAEELKQSKEHAEAATARAENAKLIAEEAVKAKQQFLSNMSHEIRTPLNAIIGFTDVVLKTELSAKQKECLGAIKISGDALILLINDILDLAKAEAGKMTFEHTQFRLDDSIAAMLHLFETKISEKKLELIKDFDSRIPDFLIGDPLRLHQIILNLVSNAIKFTAKGCITLKVELLNENEETVCILFTVSDTGIGIEEGKLESIFENFQQATDSTSRQFGGTGLGLAIVKQLVELQGGSVYVKSKLGVGSAFSFELSFQKLKAEAEIDKIQVPEETVISVTNNKNIKILVAEDMELNQLLVKTILDDFGFENDIVENGKAAIEKVQTKTYDVILMDLQMPEMSGFEATDYIRRKLNSNIPIIALTADVTSVDLSKCKAVGMNDYIAKPFDEKILYQKIISVIV